MELVNKLVSRGDNYYILDRIDDYGMIYAKSAIGAVSGSAKRYTIDPFDYKVMVYEDTYYGYEAFSDEEMKSLLELDSRVPMREVDRVVGYKNSKQEYLLVFYTNTGKIHIIFLSMPDMYGLVLNKNHLDMPREVFDFSCSIPNIGEKFPGVGWLEKAKVFKYIDGAVNPCVLEILGRMLHDFPDCVRVNLPVLQNYNYIEGSRYGMKLVGNSYYMVVNPYSLNWEMSKRNAKGKRVSRELLAEYLESNYNYPCAHFEDEELEKVVGILKHNGYDEIVEDVKKENGRRSNFKVESKNERVCIMDANKGSAYSVHRLVIVPVVSAMGIPLYYEIRMYPLCGSDSYRVLFSSCRLESCEKIIEYPYANLIRGNLLELKDFFFSVTKVIDTNVDITIRYSYYGAKGKIYSATYNKNTGVWDYIEKSTTGYDEKFLRNLLCVFDSIAKVKAVVREKYVVYHEDNGRFIIDKLHEVGSCRSFGNCKNIIEKSEWSRFLIVKYSTEGIGTGKVSEVKRNTWVYEKSKNILNSVNTSM